MNLISKNGVGLALAAALLGLAANTRAEDAPIQIGVTVPITGALSLTGKQYHNSLQMAEDDINSANGINGRKLKFNFEDTQASNGTAVNAFVKLAQEVKPPFFMLSSYSTQNLAVAPEVKKVAVPAFYAGGADVITDAGNEWMFRIRPADSLAAAGMERCATQILKASKPGILYIQNDFGQGGMQVATKRFEDAGVPVVGVEAYGQNDKDFSAQLLSLRAKGADVLLVFAYPQDGALLLRQVKMLGLKMPIVTSSSPMVPAALALVTPADLENVWGVVDVFVDPAVSPAMNSFVTRYKTRFGVDSDPYALAYYDAAHMLADGLRKVGQDPKQLRDWIANVKNWQGTGHVYTFDAKRNGVHDVSVVKAKSGTKTLELVETIRLD